MPASLLRSWPNALPVAYSREIEENNRQSKDIRSPRLVVAGLGEVWKSTLSGISDVPVGRIETFRPRGVLAVFQARIGNIPFGISHPRFEAMRKLHCCCLVFDYCLCVHKISHNILCSRSFRCPECRRLEGLFCSSQHHVELRRQHGIAVQAQERGEKGKQRQKLYTRLMRSKSGELKSAKPSCPAIFTATLTLRKVAI